jgi:rod shape determining protein RodA
LKRMVAPGTLNWTLLATTLVVGGLGIVNLYSASETATSNLALVQGIWLGVGIGIALVLTVLDYRIFERLAYPVLIVTLLLLLAVLFMGRVISGSQRWLHLGAFNFQPSEMAKIAVILAVAKYYSDEPSIPPEGYTLRALIKPATILYPLGAVGALVLYWEKIPDLGGLRFLLLVLCVVWAAACFLYSLRSGRTSLHDLLSPLILVALPSLLILRQPDLGTTLVLFAIAGTITLFVKVKPLSLIIAALALVVAATSAWFFVLEDYQKNRIFAFMEPSADIKGSGYHAWQSSIAVGSGGVSGKGFRESTQTQFKFLPEQHTDFVFSVWAEEWGFTGCLVVIGLFFFWLMQMINVASSARERFGVLVSVGVVALVFWHTAINIGMVIGLLPVVGITLPLWSYGGSSLLATMVALGLLLSVSLRRHNF